MKAERDNGPAAARAGRLCSKRRLRIAPAAEEATGRGKPSSSSRATAPPWRPRSAETQEEEEVRRRQQPASGKVSCRSRRRGSSSEAPDGLEDDPRVRRVDPDALSRRESNAFVQKVLDAHRFGFTLLDHQYEAARCVAGLPYLWPRTLVNDRADDTLEQAPLTADRHLILADQMGLGKTVSTLAGAVLRRAVAAFHSRHAPKAVLVITPNAAVMHQWSEHIDRAHGLVHVYGGGGARDGKLKARLELYEKEAARGGEVRTLYVLTTKYAVQSAAMDACNFSAPKPCALFPTSAEGRMKLAISSRPTELGACPASTRRRRVLTHSQPLRGSKTLTDAARL